MTQQLYVSVGVGMTVGVIESEEHVAEGLIKVSLLTMPPLSACLML